MASEILTRLRANDDLKDIPIHFAIYKQSDQNSITPENLLLILQLMMIKLKLINGKIDQVSALLPSSTAKIQ